MTRLMRIIDRIQKRLEAIKTSDGYQTDAGRRTILVDTEADPLQKFDDGQQGQMRHTTGLVLMLGGSEPIADAGNVLSGAQAVMHQQDVSIFGFAPMKDRADWFELAEKLRADITRALFSRLEDRRYFKDCGISSIKLAAASGLVPAHGAEYVGVEVALSITYAEDLTRPWVTDDD